MAVPNVLEDYHTGFRLQPASVRYDIPGSGRVVVEVVFVPTAQRKGRVVDSSLRPMGRTIMGE